MFKIHDKDIYLTVSNGMLRTPKVKCMPLNYHISPKHKSSNKNNNTFHTKL